MELLLVVNLIVLSLRVEFDFFWLFVLVVLMLYVIFLLILMLKSWLVGRWLCYICLWLVSLEMVCRLLLVMLLVMLIDWGLIGR